MHFWKATAGLVSILAVGGSSVFAFEHRTHDTRDFVPPLYPRSTNYELEARDANKLNEFQKRAPLFFWHSVAGNAGLDISERTAAVLGGCVVATCSVSYMAYRGWHRAIAEIAANLHLTPEQFRTVAGRVVQAGVRGITGDQSFHLEDLQGSSQTSTPSAAEPTPASGHQATESHEPITPHPTSTSSPQAPHSHDSDAPHAVPGHPGQAHSEAIAHPSSPETSRANPASHIGGVHHSRDYLESQFEDDFLFARDILSFYEDEFDF